MAAYVQELENERDGPHPIKWNKRRQKFLELGRGKYGEEWATGVTMHARIRMAGKEPDYYCDGP